MTTTKMSELDDKFKVRISFELSDKTFTVEAPLPDNFGMTVGSEFSAPFDANFLSGTMSKVAAVVSAKASKGDSSGIGNKLGVVTKKYYSNPEPSEISFDLQFEAYYDAKTEVMFPIIQLMAMGLGRSVSKAQAQQYLSNLIAQAGLQKLADTVAPDENIDFNDPDTADRVFDFLDFVAGPPLTKIEFGNVLTLKKVYVSSVAPQFSNILDKNGYPMSATCSITAVLEKDPIITDNPNEGFRSFFEQDASAGIDWELY